MACQQTRNRRSSRKIIAREIPADIVFETDRIIAFRDIAPQAPVHLLVVPEDARNTATSRSSPQATRRSWPSWSPRRKRLATEHSDGEFRLVFNTGAAAGQTVFHVHAHVLGGELAEGTLARQ